MPKGRVAQAGEQAARADAAALVVTIIIANGGALICGKALLLQFQKRNAPAGKGRRDGSIVV
jgi:hypothetical protein